MLGSASHEIFSVVVCHVICNSQVYEDVFELVFLENSRSFYMAEAQKYIRFDIFDEQLDSSITTSQLGIP